MGGRNGWLLEGVVFPHERPPQKERKDSDPEIKVLGARGPTNTLSAFARMRQGNRDAFTFSASHPAERKRKSTQRNDSHIPQRHGATQKGQEKSEWNPP